MSVSFSSHDRFIEKVSADTLQGKYDVLRGKFFLFLYSFFRGEEFFCSLPSQNTQTVPAAGGFSVVGIPTVGKSRCQGLPQATSSAGGKRSVVVLYSISDAADYNPTPTEKTN